MHSELRAEQKRINNINFYNDHSKINPFNNTKYTSANTSKHGNFFIDDSISNDGNIFDKERKKIFNLDTIDENYMKLKQMKSHSEENLLKQKRI